MSSDPSQKLLESSSEQMELGKVEAQIASLGIIRLTVV